jgi:hypothetical protein
MSETDMNIAIAIASKTLSGYQPSREELVLLCKALLESKKLLSFVEGPKFD